LVGHFPLASRTPNLHLRFIVFLNKKKFLNPKKKMVWVVMTQPPQLYESKAWDPCETSFFKKMVLGTSVTESGQWIWIFSNVIDAEEGKQYIEKKNQNTTMKLMIEKRV